MILEAATLRIKPGRINEFESAFRSAYGIVSGMRGYLGHELYKCVENKDEYILLVRWSSIKDVAVGFRKSPEYRQWLELLEPFYDPQPETKHYIDIRVGGREQAEARYLQDDSESAVKPSD